MKDFQIFKLNEYESYVLLISNEDIYFLYDKLKKVLNNQKIIIDLFYKNGFSFNRFIEIDLNKSQNKKSRIVNPRFVSENIKNNTKDYFKNNQILLNTSSLSKGIKEFVIAN